MISENLHGGAYVAMVAELFGGQACKCESIADLDMNGINWDRMNADQGGLTEKNRSEKQRDGESNPRKRRRKQRKSQ